jgi:putative ABC transport system ATP-binding protein
MALIELHEVCKSYFLPTYRVDVLRGIEFQVQEGEFVAIMGPSGSGKSTLLNIVGCLDRPTRGRYLLQGQDMGGKSDAELAQVRNQEIGFVFQSFNLLPRYPAWKNVELPLVYSGLSPAERKRRALQMLERFGLLDRATHTPAELSGGEQQRVAIARALINNPAIVLADEPTGNLDSRSGAEVLDIFQGLHRQGVTILLVTHEMEVARRAQRVITIRDGVCQDGCY